MGLADTAGATPRSPLRPAERDRVRSPLLPDPPRAPFPDLRRRIASLCWYGLVPLVAAFATMRWLIPAPAEIGPGAWGALAAWAELHSLGLAVALFLLFAGLVRCWRDLLPFSGALTPAPRPDHLRPRRWLSPLALVVAPALAALLLRAGVGQIYQVAGSSMLPTLLPGDAILMSKLGLPPLRRGDVIAFRTPAAAAQAPDDRLVKRVIGLPGDHITMRAGIPRINGWEVPHCDAGTYVRYAATGTLVGRLLVEFIDDRVYLAVHVPGTVSFPGYDVQPGEVFVVGDDRSNSDDSRAWNGGKGGGVPLALVEGRPWRVVGADPDGRVDFHRFLQRPGLQVHLPGVDVSGLEQGIARCLANRPQHTSPPPPPPAATTSPA